MSTLSVRARLGPYEILAPLDAGGMGEVYRARDTKLGREVALKVLPAAFAGDPERMARFQREAQMLASLNHPNIASIYGLEESGGVRALVMELVEGPTLAERIGVTPRHAGQAEADRMPALQRGGGALPLEEVLPIAKQIAEALEYAHEHGIIHRDLKPANVKVTVDGIVKVLDFGLAKALEDPLVVQDISSSPTLSAAAIPHSGTGIILGTAAYMSPEQARGKPMDKRTDIWSFGAVLYEMLAGRQAFVGETTSDTLAAVLRAEMDWNALPRGTPEAIQELLRRCLDREAKRRLQAIGEARIAIEDALSGGERREAQVIASGGAASSARRAVAPWILTAVLGTAFLVLVLVNVLRAPKPLLLVRSTIDLPSGFHLDTENASLALSPDGQRLAFVGSGPDGKQQLWLRPMDSVVAKPLAETEGATYPFWSPDSRFIGFFASHRLKRIEPFSGILQTICEAPDGRGATWSQRGEIVFAPHPFGALYEVPASGGTPSPVTNITGNAVTHRLPFFLPDGKRLLFFSQANTNATENEIYEIYLLDLGSKKTQLVATGNSEGRFVEPGYLVFVKDRNLMGQPFDRKNGHTSGEAAPIAEGIMFNSSRWTGEFSFSDTGLLVYQAGSALVRSRLTWFDLNGRKLGTVGESARFDGIFLSPDGERGLLPVADADGRDDLLMYDLRRGVATRFAFGADSYKAPVWSPDGRNVVYGDTKGNLYLKPSDGSSEGQRLFSDGIYRSPSSWSPDGRFLVFIQSGPGFEVWLLPMVSDRKPQRFISSSSNNADGSFSPDGRWFLYFSDESGGYELYVVPFPGPGKKLRVSSGGATFASWFSRGRQIVYITPDRKLVAVDVNPKGQDLEIGGTHYLFGGRPLPADPTGSRFNFPADFITSDQKRLLLPVPEEEGPAPGLTLVTNWSAGLKR